MSDRLLLHRGVDDDALELDGLDGLDLHRRLDGELQQALQAFFADGAAKAPDLRRIAWQPRFVVVQAAEELPDHVLAPALHQFLVAEVEAVLQVQQAGHEANRQARAARVAHTAAEFHGVLAKQIGCDLLIDGAILTIELRRQRGFDLRPGQSRRQHHQRVPHVDHGIQARAEKVRCTHGANPPEINSSHTAS